MSSNGIPGTAGAVPQAQSAGVSLFRPVAVEDGQRDPSRRFAGTFGASRLRLNGWRRAYQLSSDWGSAICLWAAAFSLSGSTLLATP